MSYADFTLDSLRHAFGLKVRDQGLFEQVGTIEHSYSWEDFKARYLEAFGEPLPL